ncbi:MAG: TonB family protein [Bryobacteraceae bacterium]
MPAFSFLVGVAVKSSAVLAVAWLSAWLLRGRAAALRHLMWTATAASVLALPLLSLVLPAVRMPASGALLALVPDITFQAGARAGAATAARSGPAAPQAKPAPVHSRIDWRLFPMLIWAAGALVGLAQMAVAGGAIAGARRRARAHPAQAESAALSAAIGTGDTVAVLEAPPGSMPMTWGLFRPAVFLPADACDWNAERRRMVLLHELAHVRRGDAGAHILARTALALHWWNPLAWLAWRESLKERERAADDLVLLTGERASAYAGHLLEVARALQSRPPMQWAALAMARRSQLEGRLLAILDPRIPRNSVARISALAVVLLAVILVAPFAAMRAQDQPAPRPPELTSPLDVEYTIRATTDYRVLDEEARQFARQKQYGSAQKLLAAALQLREKSAGRQGAEYSEGLVKLGDLARVRKQYTEAAAFYQQAVAAVAGEATAARPLTSLGVMLLDKKDYPQALDYFQKARAADPDHSGLPLTWTAVTYSREDGAAAQADAAFQQAIAADDPASADAATTQELYAIFLKLQGRDSESDAVQEKAVSIRKALGAQVAKAPGAGSGVYKVGDGTSAPAVLIKGEPEYSEDARVAKYMGKVVLFVEIGPDGVPHNIRVIRGLGLGLNETAIDAVSQWKFKPGTRDGVPVTVAATIEVNFRLL